MCEDLPQKLVEPFALGITTVRVRGDAAWIADEPEGKRPAAWGETHDHVHHAVDDLVEFLGRVRHAESEAALR